MSQILAPCLELLWRLANGFTEAGDGISETVRIEVGQTSIDKCITENCTSGSSRDPVFPFETFDCLAFGVLPSSH
jgi:hypothetical protein